MKENYMNAFFIAMLILLGSQGLVMGELPPNASLYLCGRVKSISSFGSAWKNPDTRGAVSIQLEYEADSYYLNPIVFLPNDIALNQMLSMLMYAHKNGELVIMHMPDEVDDPNVTIQPGSVEILSDEYASCDELNAVSGQTGIVVLQPNWAD